MKPTRGRTENTAFAPIYFNDLIAIARFVWTYPGFLRPHEGVSFGAKDQKNRASRMKMRFVIASHRPFGEVTDQRAATHIERGNAHAVSFRLGGIHQRATGIGDKVRLPVKKPPLKLPIRCRHKIVSPAVETLIECIIATKDKRDVVQQVNHQRRARHSQENSRLAAAIDHSVRAIKRSRKETPLVPLELDLFLFVI